jgi:hypothetical protein
MALEVGEFERLRTKIKGSLRLPPNDLLAML